MEDASLTRWSKQDWHQKISTYLENSECLPQEASEQAHWAEQKSQAMRLRRRFLEIARDQSEAKGQGPNHFEAEERLDQACAVADDIIQAYSGLPYNHKERLSLDATDVRRKLSLTYHADPRNLTWTVKNEGSLAVARDSLEHGVRRYLESTFKDPDIDRVLLLALTHMEITSFIEEMTAKCILTGKSRVDRLNVNLNGCWIKGRIIEIVLIAAVSAGVFSGSYFFNVVPSWVGFGALILGAIIFFISSLRSRRNIPVVREQLEKMKDGVTGNMGRMSSFYAEFTSDGPISTAYFRQELIALKEKGVVWPVSIWALLDDVEDRGLKFV